MPVIGIHSKVQAAGIYAVIEYENNQYQKHLNKIEMEINRVNPYKNDKKDLEASQSMNELSNAIFAPIYPVIAAQIKEKFKITNGNCIDIGSGPATLSISLARITDLQIYAMDASKHSYEIAKNNIATQGLQNRISTIIGKAQEMPFSNNFADLIISRGSIFFWENLEEAFNEILRVLKPGGQTYIGGGFGNSELRESIFKKMYKRNDDFFRNGRGMLTPENLKQIIPGIESAIKQSNVSDYDISRGDFEFWIHIKKIQL